MSTIGAGGIGPLNQAGSFSGSQRPDASDDRQKAEASDRKSEVDRDQRSARALEDVSDPELSADRDADGRMPPGEDEPPSDARHAQDETETQGPVRHSRDAEGIRGRSLDLDV